MYSLLGGQARGGSTRSSSDCGVSSPVGSGGASASSNRQRTIGELSSKLPCHTPTPLPPFRVPRDASELSLKQCRPAASHVQRPACAVQAMRGCVHA